MTEAFAHSGIPTKKYYLKPNAVADSGRFITADVDSTRRYAARSPVPTDEMKQTRPLLKL